MTLRTVSGPTIAAALADARRLFGADAVVLQSTPSAAGQPASVTVAFDEPPRPKPAAPARPGPAAAAPRTYGYGATRKVRPAVQEPASALPPSAPTPVARTAAAASAAEVAELRARLAVLEARLAQNTPAPARHPALVLVGPSGSGKTALALRLSQTPSLLDAQAPAVLVIAPEEGVFIDPASTFWGTGVPVVVVRTEADVREALATFSDSDLLIVDTPSLPLQPERAAPFVARLATLLGPLAPLDVHFVADASRPASLTTEAVAALGLRPDALALTRLDEAAEGAKAWRSALAWPLRLTSSGTTLDDVERPAPLTAPPLEPPDAPPAETSVPHLVLPPPPRRAASSAYLDSLLKAAVPCPEATAEAATAGPLVFAE